MCSNSALTGVALYARVHAAVALGSRGRAAFMFSHGGGSSSSLDSLGLLIVSFFLKKRQGQNVLYFITAAASASFNRQVLCRVPSSTTAAFYM